MQVFYVNIGGGEPTVRPDFWDLVDYATAHHVGVKFSTNGDQDHPGRSPARLAASDYVDVQISLDGATAEVNDAVRGPGSYATALRAMEHLAAAGFRGFKISVVVTRQNAGQLDDVQGDRRPVRRAAAADPAAAVRPRRGRLGRAAPHRGPAAAALRLAGGPRRAGADRRLVLPPGRLRRPAARAEPVRRGPGGLPDRPGRRRLRLPVRHPRQLPGRATSAAPAASPRCGGTRSCSPSCAGRRPAGACQSCSAYDSCRGGCMAAKFFTGLPLDGPDPECVKGHGERALAAVGRGPRAQAVRRSFAPVPAGAGAPSAAARLARTSPAQTGPGLRREPAGRLPSLTGPGSGHGESCAQHV